MPKQLLLFPFGGNAREALLAIAAINAKGKIWDVLGFLDDDPALHDKEQSGVRVLGSRDVMEEFPDASVLAVCGSPENFLNRQNVMDFFSIDKRRFARIIHPSAVIAEDAKIGHNVLIMPNVVVSCGVSIGNHCIVLPNTTISHDSFISDYCCVGSNVVVSGHVSIGPLSYVGSGARIRENIIIGPRSLVGLGANVIADVATGSIVAGNPAKRIKKCKNNELGS